MNRLFDEVFGGGGVGRGMGRQQGVEPSQWTPSLDVLSEEGDVVIRAELPGVRPEDVDITLSRGVLTIQGRRTAEEERQGAGGYLIRERRHGSFRRSMQLPEGINEDSITARFDNGVLEVRVAGVAGVQEPRRIQIESGGSESAGTPSVTSGEPGAGSNALGDATLGDAAAAGGGTTTGGGTIPEERPGEETPPAR